MVFACHGQTVQWWKQTTGTPQLRKSIQGNQVQEFFRRHEEDFSPRNIFEGKTIRRLPGKVQLDFVDAGLMPFVERTDGERLSHCVEAAFRDIETVLKRKLRTHGDVQNAIKATFWLLAAKALGDKGVDGFKNLELAKIDDVFARVGKQYGVLDGVPPDGRAWHDATIRAAERIKSFGDLRNLSTESLAHVYENALVTPKVRKANGTHSTPGPLVDYIVWQLWPWIEELPPERRHIFEPACGHAAFLVGACASCGSGRASRTARQATSTSRSTFTVSSTIRLPWRTPDSRSHWRTSPTATSGILKQADMFLGTMLEDRSRECGVLLANPPFEKFTEKERIGYKAAEVEPVARTKACELVRRTIPHLAEGACFGVVLPQGWLHSTEARDLRRTILADFELLEVDVFEDKLFGNAEHEVAVLMGRRRKGSPKSGKLWFRRVRNAGVEGFRNHLEFSSEEMVSISRFAADPEFVMRVPELGALWDYLSEYPKLTEFAKLGQGLTYKGRHLPKGAWTIHDPPEPGDTRGFNKVKIPGGLNIFSVPPEVGMNLDPSVLLHVNAGMPCDKPQVLLNYARVSRRSAWRLKATVDERGLALTSRFSAIRPKASSISILYLWAVLNSPVANAFAYCQTFKRDILVGMMRRLPVPRQSPSQVAMVEQAAIRYRALATSDGQLFNAEATPEGIKQALLGMDAAVLCAYDLPPRLERQLLDLFTGVPRKGVGCTFTGYYPPGFTSYLPLHLLLSERFQRAAADLTVKRFKPGQSEHVRKALAAATDMDEG